MSGREVDTLVRVMNVLGVVDELRELVEEMIDEEIDEGIEDDVAAALEYDEETDELVEDACVEEAVSTDWAIN